jgi:hypothetical protein
MNRRLHVYTNFALTVIAVALMAIVILLFTSRACVC